MYEYRCKVSRVVDGDTVDVDIDLGFGVWLHKERVRVLGIDTPESRTRDKEEKKYGLAAKAFVKDFFKIGDVILTTKKYDAKGKFGRILGDFQIYDGEEDRNMGIVEYMIKHNIGVEYTGQSKQQIEEHHLQNRKYLKAQGFID
jgi:micrococcal nuclease